MMCGSADGAEVVVHAWRTGERLLVARPGSGAVRGAFVVFAHVAFPSAPCTRAGLASAGGALFICDSAQPVLQKGTHSGNLLSCASSRFLCGSILAAARCVDGTRLGLDSRGTGPRPCIAHASRVTCACSVAEPNWRLVDTQPSERRGQRRRRSLPCVLMDVGRVLECRGR